jgi:hypothetical protein
MTTLPPLFVAVVRFHTFRSLSRDLPNDGLWRRASTQERRHFAD